MKTSKKKKTINKKPRVEKKPTLDGISEGLEYCREFAPSLVMARATLLPFEDVICGESAGPQPKSKHDNPGDEPYLTIDIDDRGNSPGQTWARVTAHGVTIGYTIVANDGREFLGDEIQTNLSGLWEYLRQLPRSAGAFFQNR